MVGFTLDMKDIEKVNKQLEKINKQNQYQKFLREFLDEMANRVLASTKKKTPVRTGTLKGAWKLSEVKGSGTNIYIEIENPQEYATEIEYGHRIVRNGVEIGWYNGVFMLQTSIENIQRQMPLRYEKEFAQWLKQEGLL